MINRSTHNNKLAGANGRQPRFFRYFVGLMLVGAMMFFAASEGQALDPHKAATQYVHDVWTTRDGLPQETANYIVQDNTGYIWFGTQEGLVRFDGVNFTVFDSRNTDALSASFIHALFVDRNGTLWIGATKGLVRYRDGQFKFFGKNNGLLSDEDVKNISEDAVGNLWIGYSAGGQTVAASGLGKFKDGVEQLFTVKDGLSANQVKGTFPDKSGNLWIATSHGLSLLKDGKFSTYKIADGLSDELIRAVYGGRDGALWLATPNGLKRLKDGKITTYRTQDGLSSNAIHTVYEDRDGILWIGTEAGLNRMIDGKIEPLTGVEGLDTDEVFSVFEDREGSLFIGTHVSGLHRLRDGKFTVFGTTEKLLGKNVGAIFEATDGRILIGTNPGGLNVLRDGKFETYAIADNFLKNKISLIRQDKTGLFWIGTGGGLNQFKDKNYQANFFISALRNSRINSVYETRDGVHWLSEYAGLKQVVDGKLVNAPSFANLGTNYIGYFYEDKSGRLWFGRNKETGYFRAGTFTPYPKEPLSTVNVTNIYEDETGVLWFTTWGQGLLRLKGEHLTAYTNKDGLFDDVQWAILDDGVGNMWMNCNRGVFRISKQELDDFAEGRIKIVNSVVYGTGDGMRKSETNLGYPSAIRARDGKLWFATTDGAAVVDPKNLKINRIAPPVVIEKVLVDDQLTVPNGAPFITSQVKNIEFRYAGLSFIQPTKMKYKYRLEGFDTGWIEAGNRRAAFYTNLPPGDYEFKVIAANSDGVWNEQGASFKFRATAPFWKTWWFYSLCLLGVAGLTLLVFRWRVAKLEQEKLAQQKYAHRLIESQEAERKRIAAELHDGLGQSLLVIKNRTIIGKKLAPDSEKMQTQFEEISKATGQALEEVRSIAYNLRPYHLERLGLRESIEAMLEKIREATGLEINARIALYDEVFSKDDEVTFYRVIQECLNNIIKHANATAVEINIVQTETEVTARLQDNGRGFAVTPENQSSGFGLIGMSERVRMLGGQLSIASEVGKGTTVTVIIPLHEEKDEH